MKNVLLFGAGKSATCLIDYLLREAASNDWMIIVCDNNLALAQSKIGDAPNARAASINVKNDADRNTLIREADIVISLLPPELHFIVAKDCLLFKKNLLTASYIDENIKTLANEIDSSGLLFLYEMGLDPGIDHMSAMKMIKSIKEKGATITSFLSHCGGLVAPESDNNPWHYKVTWNPRNVVMAGKDGALFREQNKTVTVPYKKIFNANHFVKVPGLDEMAWYPNRDSLSYISLYQLENIDTFIRTTLRYPEFCRGWNKLVEMNCTATNDTEEIKHCKTFEEWFTLKNGAFDNGDKDTNQYEDEFDKQMTFLGLCSRQNLHQSFTCSADILQFSVENKLAMASTDRDMIVMLHQIEYTLKEQRSLVNSSLVVKGEDSLRTAMAKTVGLPLGIATKLILQKKINVKGLHIPVLPEIYEPVLIELEQNGIKFEETTELLS